MDQLVYEGKRESRAGGWPSKIASGRRISKLAGHFRSRMDNIGAGWTTSTKDGGYKTADQAGEQFDDLTGDLDQPDQDVGRSDTLASYLKQVGIRGKAYERLLARPDLLLEPAPVLGWWWYGLTLERVHNPMALAANYLLAGNPAPAGFLALARWWPTLTEEKRLAMEEMILANWSASRMVDYWSEACTEVTAGTIVALKELYLTEVGVLGL